MSRFIVVIHTWFMESKGFEIHELEAKDFNSAELEARRLTEKGQDTFNSRAFKLIEISDSERIVNRKLDWTERLTGHLSNTN